MQLSSPDERSEIRGLSRISLSLMRATAMRVGTAREARAPLPTLPYDAPQLRPEAMAGGACSALMMVRTCGSTLSATMEWPSAVGCRAPL